MQPVPDFSFLYPMIPELVIMTGMLAVLFADLFVKQDSYRITGYIALLAVVLATFFLLLYSRYDFSVLNGMFELTAQNFPVKLLILLVTFLILSISDHYMHHRQIHYGEYHFLILTAGLSFMLTVSTSNIIMLITALETGTLCSYILCGIRRSDYKSAESAMKYFFIGAFASAFILYGIALLYGASGSLDMRHMFYSDNVVSGENKLFAAGILLLLSGLLMKIGIAPFHFWVADVYRGAPAPVTAFLATVPKIAMVWLCAKVVSNIGEDYAYIRYFVATAGILSAFIGAVSAFRQKNLKNLLAYSSVGQIGYLFIIIGINPGNAGSDIYFYLAVYVVGTAGLFGCLCLLESGLEPHQELTVNSLRGLGFTNFTIAAAISVFVLSYAGIPLTGGFIAKFTVYSTIFSSGSLYISLAVIISSLISLAYLFKIVYVLGSRVRSTGEISAVPQVSGIFVYKTYFGVMLAFILTTLLGLFPNFFLILAEITAG